jgi:hypothetical protein
VRAVRARGVLSPWPLCTRLQGMATKKSMRFNWNTDVMRAIKREDDVPGGETMSDDDIVARCSALSKARPDRRLCRTPWCTLPRCASAASLPLVCAAVCVATALR